MSSTFLNRAFLFAAFVLGLAAIAWVGVGFVGTSAIALGMTVLIGAVYLIGAQEIRRFRALTASLEQAISHVPQPLALLGDWMARVPPVLQNAVRQRVEGERGALPGLALTPYLIGLLVMLGMLGTFLGMVVTFKGAVFALEGSTDLQAIRSALAAPIRGLGLSFGTSVAGVATSAMLGLMAALARRERVAVVRALDAKIATDFRPFSPAQQRNLPASIRGAMRTGRWSASGPSRAIGWQPTTPPRRPSSTRRRRRMKCAGLSPCCRAS